MGQRRRAMVLAVVAVLAVLAPARSEAVIPVASPATSYRNPVFNADFPDPFVMRGNGVFVALATNGPNVQVVTSLDLRNWVLHRDAMPTLPSWAAPGRTWAPAMLRTRIGYVLYYAAHHRTGGISCIGRAMGPTATGPFVDNNPVPLVCQSGSRGGSIDPSPFADEHGRPWLLWKSEGTPGIEPTRIWSRPLRPDGLAFVGDAVELLRTDQPWEGPIIENPSMARLGGKLLLFYSFYSGGRWQDASYGIGWAHCHGPAGPCTKDLGPWVASRGPVAGPGGQEFFRGPSGSLWMAYHAWDADRVGYDAGGKRTLRIDRVVMHHGEPVLYGPTHTPDVPFD